MGLKYNESMNNNIDECLSKLRIIHCPPHWEELIASDLSRRIFTSNGDEDCLIKNNKMYFHEL